MSPLAIVEHLDVLEDVHARLGAGRVPALMDQFSLEGAKEALDHGDYCLPNIVLQDWRLIGFVDWGRAGVADRYQDIALTVRSVGSNFGSEWVDVLFEACGVEPDYAKVRFYMLLDEFF